MEEQAYQNLMVVITDPSTLYPFHPERQTHVIADSSEEGMQGSIYQELDTDTWIPTDHASRALTPTEQQYTPIERESMAQSLYIVGQPFTAWTDHEPVVQIYNNKQKPVSKRIAKHRDMVQDQQYNAL